MDTIGFIELTSIAKGIEVADAMLKAANTELIFAKASCPGKYYIMIAGNVDSVNASITQGNNMGDSYIVDSLVLSKIHPQVIKAINMGVMPNNIRAVGVMEFFSVTSAITSADVAVKSSSVDLIDIRLGTGIGGKSFVVLTGDVASVNSAVDTGSYEGAKNGMLVNKIVIARPREELIESLF